MDIVAETIREFVNNALGVNLREMMIQIAATLVLFLVVRFFFWNHITNYLNKQNEAIKQAYDEAETSKTEAETLKQDAQLEFEKIQLSAKETLEEAKSRGKKQEQEIVKTAKETAVSIVKNAEDEVERLYDKAKESMQDEIISVATVMAEKVIQKEIDEEKYKSLLKEATDEVSS